MQSNLLFVFFSQILFEFLFKKYLLIHYLSSSMLTFFKFNDAKDKSVQSFTVCFLVLGKRTTEKIFNFQLEKINFKLPVIF